MPINYDKAEIKNFLRTKEFPYSARDALSRAEEMLSSGHDRQQAIKNAELAQEIITEFVFNEIDRRGARRKLTCLQEFELMLVICDHMAFDKTGNFATRNSLFLSLFPYQSLERRDFLVSLISLAITLKYPAVLNATAIIFQQLGCSSPFSVGLASSLISDFFVLVPVDSVIELPIICRAFVCNFLTALSETFHFDKTKRKQILPGQHMIKIIMQWLKSDPSLTLPLESKYQPVLPHGAILMPIAPPFAGLLKWCIFSEDMDPLCDCLVPVINKQLRSFFPFQDTVNIICILKEYFYDKMDRPLKVLVKFLVLFMINGNINGPMRHELWRHMESLPRTAEVSYFLQEYRNYPV